jgi:hypothetical protein
MPAAPARQVRHSTKLGFIWDCIGEGDYRAIAFVGLRTASRRVLEHEPRRLPPRTTGAVVRRSAHRPLTTLGSKACLGTPTTAPTVSQRGPMLAFMAAGRPAGPCRKASLTAALDTRCQGYCSAPARPRSQHLWPAPGQGLPHQGAGRQQRALGSRR